VGGGGDRATRKSLSVAIRKGSLGERGGEKSEGGYSEHLRGDIVRLSDGPSLVCGMVTRKNGGQEARKKGHMCLRDDTCEGWGIREGLSWGKESGGEGGFSLVTEKKSSWKEGKGVRSLCLEGSKEASVVSKDGGGSLWPKKEIGE